MSDDGPQDPTQTAVALFARLHELETSMARIKTHLVKVKATVMALPKGGEPTDQEFQDAVREIIKTRELYQELEEDILTVHAQLVRLPVIDENSNVNTGLIQLFQSLWSLWRQPAMKIYFYIFEMKQSS